jgi:hypothetical protein
MSGRQRKVLALVSVMALVLLGALSGCHKPSSAPTSVTGIAMCNADTIKITPGDQTHPPSVSVKVCTIRENETITWQCQGSGCTGWQVMFDDPNVVDTLLFQNSAVTFGDTGGTGKDHDSATLAPGNRLSKLLSNGPIVVKYSVQTVGSPPADPHIIPMGP